MLLQLAESAAPARQSAQIEYINLPVSGYNVRADYYDRKPLAEMAADLSENGYTLDEISQLAAKRSARKAAAAPSRAAAAPRTGIFGGAKKAARQEFKAEKRTQKITKKAAKTEKKQATAAKRRDTGAAKKAKAQARIIKASRQEPTEREELFNTVIDTAAQSFTPEQEQYFPDNGGQEFDQEQYFPETESEAETVETVETEEVTPEEMSEYLSASKKERRKKLTASLVKGLTTAAKAYTAPGSTKKPAGTVKLPKPKPEIKDTWNETLFNIGNTPVTKKAAAVTGTILIIGGIAISKK